MKDMKELILTLIRPLVSYPEELALEIVESDEFYEYHVSLHPKDIGRVIGKQGRVATAIRTIVYSVKVKGPKRVRLTIVDN
ncbi:MAG: KH domain-containing protein [Pisciglobus halotolerans]|nr:KH domain-containing protein [Pisciglobus halotolerans]